MARASRPRRHPNADAREQALRAAEALPKARVFNATGLDPDFLERERIGHAQAGIFAMRDDAKNQYAATLARVHGIPFTVAIAHGIGCVIHQTMMQANVASVTRP